jgi:hypothetical protein
MHFIKQRHVSQPSRPSPAQASKPENIKHRENAELSHRHHNSPHHNQLTGKSKSKSTYSEFVINPVSNKDDEPEMKIN